MNKRTENPILQQALFYHRLGWAVIPIPYKSKAAKIRWKKYQNNRPDEARLRKWFGNGQLCNIAVLFGDVSGGLACRDFDTIPEYTLWAEQHPELARTLPQVQTARGMHVYFEGHIDGIQKIRNGELRGSGGYCLLPTSVHPDGAVYQWKIPIQKENLHCLDPKKAGFMNRVTDETDVTEDTDETNELMQYGKVGCVDKEVFEKYKNEIEQAILETIPEQEGQRNHTVFQFARYLQAYPELKQIQADLYLPLVERWHQKALPHIKTKEFEETWIDFVVGWYNVKVPKGVNVMDLIIQKARENPVQQFSIPQLNLLAGICRELQAFHRGHPFFLSARTAGRLLQKDPMTAWRWLQYLELRGWIKTVKKGNEYKASRYRYLFND